MKVAIVVIALVIVGSVGGYFAFRKEAPPPVPVEEVAKSNLEREVIGKSVEGRDIESFTIGNGPKKLLFIGGIHGGYEWNTVTLAYRFVDYLEANPDLVPESVTVMIIPSANPDGVHRVLKNGLSSETGGRFEVTDVSQDKQVLASGRFNAREVDLNRNFDCEWQPKSTWQSRTVSAGSAPFSEPEALAIKNFVAENKPTAVISWHSQGNAVYASKCEEGILSETLKIMNAYSRGSGYRPVETFDSYATTGDSEGWLASIGIPAITVELKTHETVEFEQNLAGVKALFEYYK